MKPNNRATHLVLLQRTPKGLLWLETKRDNDSLIILSAGLESLSGPDAEESAAEPDSTAWQDALQAVNAKIKLGWMVRHEVTVIAPSHRLTTRFLDTPPVEEGMLEDLVSFEVSEALQIPIRDIAWDSHMSSRHGDRAEKKLLWIATRKAFIESFLSGWPENRLFPTQVTPDFWGYYEYLLETESAALSEPALILSREGNRGSITIADKEAIYLTRSIPLNRPARMNGDLEGTDAEEYALAMEIERTLYYAADKSAPGEPRSMICCGFDDWKLERMRTAAEGNGLTLMHLTVNSVLRSYDRCEETVLPEHLSLLCMAFCQLKHGVTGPNLLEMEEEPVDWKSFIPEAAFPSRKLMTMGGSLLAVFLVLLIGKSIWFNSAVASRLDRGKDLITLANRLQKEEIALRQLSRNNIDYAKMFLFLSEKLPEGILVKNLGIDARTGMELSLKGGNNKQAVELQKILNESPYFRDVVLDRSVVEKDGFAIYLKGKMQPAR